MKYWLLHWMPRFLSIYWRSDIVHHFHFIKIDFVNIYCSIAYILDSRWFYEVLTKQVSLHIHFLLLCLGQVYISWLYFSLLADWLDYLLGGDLWGGNLPLSYNTLPSQNPRSPRTSPLGLTTPKRYTYLRQSNNKLIYERFDQWVSTSCKSMTIWYTYKQFDNKYWRSQCL
jgi:hypothetical protein